MQQGAEYRGLLGKIRLLRKRSLLDVPSVLEYINVVLDILSQISIEEEEDGYGGQDRRFFTTKEVGTKGKELITNLVTAGGYEDTKVSTSISLLSTLVEIAEV